MNATRRTFILSVGSALVAWPSCVAAQQRQRMYRIGVLSPGIPPPGPLERASALFVFDDVLMTTHKRQILDWAAKVRLPVISQYAELAEAGGLMAYGPNIPDIYRRAATYVDRILKGAKPTDLPVEQPTRVELVLNLRSAKALGVRIPDSILVRADKVLH